VIRRGTSRIIVMIDKRSWIRGLNHKTMSRHSLFAFYDICLG